MLRGECTLSVLPIQDRKNTTLEMHRTKSRNESAQRAREDWKASFRVRSTRRHLATFNKIKRERWMVDGQREGSMPVTTTHRVHSRRIEIENHFVRSHKLANGDGSSSWSLIAWNTLQFRCNRTASYKRNRSDARLFSVHFPIRKSERRRNR